MIENIQTYSFEEAMEESLKYFNGDYLSASSAVNKYLLKDENNRFYEKSPADMLNRIASEIYRVESKYPNPMSKQEISYLLDYFKYVVLGGGGMSGVGNNLQIQSISNCFVVGNKADSYGGLLMADQQAAQLMKRRGGVGNDLSHIRPKGSPVKNSARTSTGVVPFMERYSSTTKEVAQDGRRGALMLSISIKHPDAEDFIDAKLEQNKVTGANISVKIDNEFMQAVINNTPYTQQYPIDSANPIYTKTIDARKLWKKIIYNAWKSAEPGILFWDTIINESIPDCYSQFGYGTVTTNPCITGDMYVAVADGRRAVKISELASAGVDVPVYCVDEAGKLYIRTMRHPRVTGHKQQIYKVTTENNHILRVTGNHKFILRDGTHIEAKDLKCGDSLRVLSREERTTHSKRQYYFLNCGTSDSIQEHRLIASYTNNVILDNKNIVVHHIDNNGLNNSPDNLKIMSKIEHDELHSYDMIGDKNPYHKMTESWKYNFASHKGESNHKYINVTNDELFNIGVEITKKSGKRLSKSEWISFAKQNGLPTSFSKHRSEILGNITSFLIKCAESCGFENADIDPRIAKTLANLKSQGYDTLIQNNEVLVKRKCEFCGNDFFVHHSNREFCFCGTNCSIQNLNNNKHKVKKDKAISVFSELKFKNGNTPSFNEFDSICKSEKLGILNESSYKELVEECEYFNHKVLSVEIDGYDDVYNGTVDEFHNYFISDSIDGKFFATKNCGEIPLCPYDSCRLIAINLYSYVINPFTAEASFDFNLFKDHVRKAQRFMDNFVDLELEKIDTILAKIETDPEEEEFKLVEKNLWLKIKEKCENGRRTGLGITAEGDMLAALNIRYGSDESISFVDNLHKTLKLEAYRSSVEMAKERGKFKLYDTELEANNPFINRIKEEDPQLYADMLQYGRRNIALLTIAPTGTVSMMTQTTSGIEPVFMPIYKRRRKKTNFDTKTDFVDSEGIEWVEYIVFHHKFRDYLVIKGYETPEYLPIEQLEQLVKESPYYKATANDIDWVKKVELQGVVQKHVDHSISVTVNVPKETSEEIVDAIYKTAWGSGCKGITIYRDGSRDGVLVSTKDKGSKGNSTNEVNHAPKRPAALECEVVRFINQKEAWVGFVGMLDGTPYEIFTGLAEEFDIPKTIKKGWIIKVKDKTDNNGRYDFEYLDKDGFKTRKEGLSRTFRKEYWNYAKLISSLLRHKMPLAKLIETIESLKIDDSDSIASWKAGIVRILKKFVKDGEKAGKCPVCGMDALVYQGGCVSCSNCGESKCG